MPTKDTEIPPLDDEPFPHLSPEERLRELISNTDLTDRSRWSAPINDNPREHFRRLLLDEPADVP